MLGTYGSGRLAWIAILLCLGPTGCSVTAVKPRPAVQSGGQEHVKIVGYTTLDGEHRRLEGTATFLSDSVYIRDIAHAAPSEPPGARHDSLALALSAEQVSSVDVRRFSVIRTLGLVATPVVVWYVVFLLGGFQGSDY